MQLKSIALIMAVPVLLAACSGGMKKVYVMASGKLTVNDKSIKIEPGYSYNEETLTFHGDKVALTVESTEGRKETFELVDNGDYILNLQKDTLIGGVVNYGELGVPGSIKSEVLDHIIDSTAQLMMGYNASDENKTYFITPFSVKKITDKENAIVVSSFRPIPYKVEADSKGNIPEVYKFFTNKQKRETLIELIEQRRKIQSVQKSTF